MALQNCTLTYTIFDSEDCRAILEDALTEDGWKRTRSGQQTHWTGTFDESKFITKESDGKKYWDTGKIKNTFLSYFFGVDNGTKVSVKFVLVVGNLGDRAITISGKAPNLHASVGPVEREQ